LFIFYMLRDALEPSARLRVVPGIDQRHAPWLGVPLVHNHAVVRHIESDVGHVQKIIGEILLDDIALVTAADHEIICAVRGIELHDVPENWLTADFDHRFWFEVTFLGNAGTKSAGENHDFHDAPLTARASVATPASRAAGLRRLIVASQKS